MRVRALSVREPWAQLILLGRKAAEFRTWRPTPRVLAPGQDLVICSSLRMDQSLVRRGISARLWTPAEVAEAGRHLGCARCVVRFDGAVRAGHEHASIPGYSTGWMDGRKTWAWTLSSPRPIDPPIRTKGQLYLFWVELPDPSEPGPVERAIGVDG